MNYSGRIKKLAETRGLTVYQMAEVFGVSHQVMYSWINGHTSPSPDCRRTLERFETEQRPPLSPRISEKTAKTFYGATA